MNRSHYVTCDDNNNDNNTFERVIEYHHHMKRRLFDRGRMGAFGRKIYSVGGAGTAAKIRRNSAGKTVCARLAVPRVESRPKPSRPPVALQCFSYYKEIIVNIKRL